MITRRYFTAPTFTLITCRAFFNGSLSFASYFFKQSIPSFPGHKHPVILFLLLLFGCASGSINVKESVTAKLSNYETILVEVSSNNIGYFSDAKKQMENLLISELQKKNLFKKIILSTSSMEESADLHLSIIIRDLFKVSRSDRIFWGYFVGGCFGGPGSAKIYVAVKLTEPDTTKLIGECEVIGRSSHHSTLAGTTKQAIKVAVNQIVEHIYANI